MPFFGLIPYNIEKLKAKRDIKGLVKALNYQQDIMIRKQAAVALGEIGSAQAVQPLIEVFNQFGLDFQVRMAVLAALVKIDGFLIVDFLISVIRSPRSVQFKLVAIEALGRIGDRRAVFPLIDLALKDPDKDVQNVALKTLELKSLQPQDPYERSLYAKAIQNWMVVFPEGAYALGSLIGFLDTNSYRDSTIIAERCEVTAEAALPQ